VHRRLLTIWQVCDMMVVDESLIETGVSILYHIFMFKCVAYSPPPPRFF
jgi:hypothetical protein